LCNVQKYLRSPCDLPAVMTSRDWGVKADTNLNLPSNFVPRNGILSHWPSLSLYNPVDSTDGSIAQSTANQNNPTAWQHSVHWLFGICLQETLP
jgi:hypothetical protein